MYVIREFMRDEHELLDRLFAEFLELKGRDPALARGRFDRIRAILMRRIALEDGVLFPFYEARRGAPGGGPTQAMRDQHRQIHEVLALLGEELADAARPTGRLEHELLELLAVHVAMEEEIFIPWVERLDPVARRSLQAKMAAFDLGPAA
jgi:iron-sulfur cluster repair protein YtfE (RIC family)